MHYDEPDSCISGRSLRARKATVPEVKDESHVAKVSTYEEVAVPLLDPVVRKVTMSAENVRAAVWGGLGALLAPHGSKLFAVWL